MANNILPGESAGLPNEYARRLGILPNIGDLLLRQIFRGDSEQAVEDTRMTAPDGPVRPTVNTEDVEASNDPLGLVQAPSSERGLSKMDKLMFFLRPAGAAIAAKLGGRRRGSGRRALGAAIGEGVNVLGGEASRRYQNQVARRNDILREAALKIAMERAKKMPRQRKLETGINQATGKQSFFDTDTMEVVPGFSPIPKETAERPPTMRDRTLPSGDTQTEVWDEKDRVFRPAESEATHQVPTTEPATDQRTVRTRTPFGSKRKPETLSDTEAAFQRQFGRLPNADELRKYRTGPEKPEKPSDRQVEREVERTANQVALRYLQEAQGQTAEDRVNAALENFQKRAAKDPRMAEYAKEISAAIRGIGGRVKKQGPGLAQELDEIMRQRQQQQ